WIAQRWISICMRNPQVRFRGGKVFQVWIRSKMYLGLPNRSIENSFCNAPFIISSWMLPSVLSDALPVFLSQFPLGPYRRPYGNMPSVDRLRAALLRYTILQTQGDSQDLSSRRP